MLCSPMCYPHDVTTPLFTTLVLSHHTSTQSGEARTGYSWLLPWATLEANEDGKYPISAAMPPEVTTKPTAPVPQQAANHSRLIT